MPDYPIHLSELIVKVYKWHTELEATFAEGVLAKFKALPLLNQRRRSLVKRVEEGRLPITDMRGPKGKLIKGLDTIDPVTFRYLALRAAVERGSYMYLPDDEIELSRTRGTWKGMPGFGVHQPGLWGFVVAWVRDRIGIPLTADDLEKFASKRMDGGSDHSNPITVAVAKMDTDGRTPELLSAVWNEYLKDAEDAGLPRGAGAGDGPESLDGYASADWLEHEHGIVPSRLSEATSTGDVKSRPAPAKMIDSDGKRVQKLYHVADAICHCSPKHVTKKTTLRRAPKS